ncbi:O-antigen ligase family protein [Methylomonas sp. UP202]|uniref:O-antigen ligase family protein n=1 Tax=Methylomonas sp. UP202 TaxID=3040943 RepID=UPI002479D804|nr:O-antigen ligase family protein [Methylomonas sp. UP202]WGS86591.1 O-antigen ligase family protein [Methylomonas sp. UP202]
MTHAYSDTALNVSRGLAIFAVVAVPMSTAATSIACVAMLAAWLASGKAFATLRQSWRHPLGKMIVAFYAWLVVGTFYADTDWPAKLQTLSSWKKLAYAFMLLGLFQSRRWQQRFVYYFVGVMAVAAIVAIPLWATDWVVRSGRGAGIFMTNHSTQSMAFTAALLGTLFVLHEPLSPRWKIAVWSAAALFVFNIFFVSTARSGYLALPVAAVFAFGSLYGFRKLPYFIGAAAVAVALFVATSDTVQQRIQVTLDEQAHYQTSASETSIGLRVVFYRNTWQLIREHPWLGYGTSGFKPAYEQVAKLNGQGWHAMSTGDPHNQYLFIWVENGIFGVLLFLAYIGVGLREGLANRPYGAIAASFLVAISASSLFNSHFKTFAEGYMLAFFLGALLSRPAELDDA